jgi:hypothetical protein
MASDKTNTIRIELTTEQQRIVKTATDKDVEALELNVEALEERITPTSPTESISLPFGSVHVQY